LEDLAKLGYNLDLNNKFFNQTSILTVTHKKSNKYKYDYFFFFSPTSSNRNLANLFHFHIFYKIIFCEIFPIKHTVGLNSCWMSSSFQLGLGLGSVLKTQLINSRCGKIQHKTCIVTNNISITHHGSDLGKTRVK
jgi:hypothetical protein